MHREVAELANIEAGVIVFSELIVQGVCKVGNDCGWFFPLHCALHT